MAEEDAELKELVIQSLENNGVLAKIRAQLRASVFLALDEAENSQEKKPLANPELEKYLSTKDGRIVAALIREFLLYFNLDSTLSVYEPETYFKQLYFNEDRQSLCHSLGIKVSDVNGPLLGEVIKKCPIQSNAPSPEISPDVKEPKLTESENLKSASDHVGSGDEDGGDSFFDDPLPKDDENTYLKSLPLKTTDDPGGTADIGPFQAKDILSSACKSKERDEESLLQGDGNATFTKSPLGPLLQDLPPLLEAKGKLPPLFMSDESRNPKVGLKPSSLHDDDYDEDFQSSASIQSELKSGTEEPSVEEDIEENLSGIVDEFSIGVSEGDIVTTDHTVSHISPTGVDYLETIDKLL